MTREQIIQKIAREHLSIETLEERNLDRLDFHEVSVWAVKEALEAAYEAGRNAPPAKTKPTRRTRP
jgi:hypothetical protein